MKNSSSNSLTMGRPCRAKLRQWMARRKLRWLKKACARSFSSHAPGQFALFLGNDGGDLRVGNAKLRDQVRAQHPRAAAGNGADGQFLVHRRAELAHEENIERRTQRPGDLDALRTGERHLRRGVHLERRAERAGEQRHRRVLHDDRVRAGGGASSTAKQIECSELP